jgi:hypothetical protein
MSTMPFIPIGALERLTALEPSGKTCVLISRLIGDSALWSAINELPTKALYKSIPMTQYPTVQREAIFIKYLQGTDDIPFVQKLPPSCFAPPVGEDGCTRMERVYNEIAFFAI